MRGPLHVTGEMQRWLLRFGYDGTAFAGWARQPGLRTVEGLLLSSFQPRGICSNPLEARLEVASRTDRGVGARANALALWSRLSGAPLLRRLNAISPELFFTAAGSIPPELSVRHAARRVYRYFEPRPSADVGTWEAAARLFRGRIDVRSFGRGIPGGSPQWRTVESVHVERIEGGLAIEVRAPSFVWGMVRKIVGALREIEDDRLAMSRLDAAIAGRERLTLPLAEPDGLVLWEVEYPSIPWQVFWSGPNRHQAAFARRSRDLLWRRDAVLRTILDPGALRPRWGRREVAASGPRST